MSCKRCGGTGIISGRCSGFCSCKAGKQQFNEAYPKQEDKKLYSENDLRMVANKVLDHAKIVDCDNWPGTIKIVKDYIKTKSKQTN